MTIDRLIALIRERRDECVNELRLCEIGALGRPLGTPDGLLGRTRLQGAIGELERLLKWAEEGGGR